MKERGKYLQGLIVGSAVVIALGFGVKQAAAGPTLACPIPPYIGTCSSQDECQAMCEAAYPPPPDVFGDCTAQGCCGCYF